MALFAPARTFRAIDDAVERRVEPFRNPTLDHVVYPLSSSADHSMLWHIAGLAQALRRNDPAFALRFSAAMGVESFLTNVVVKSVFQRLRPNRPPDEPLLYGLRRPITSSFPSGHATAAFCAATLLAPGSSVAPAWYALAALVAATRVYVRLHHTTDIVAGAALGLALGYALRPFVRPA
jgi:membrane-associated phospholipid phosphatase